MGPAKCLSIAQVDPIKPGCGGAGVRVFAFVVVFVFEFVGVGVNVATQVPQHSSGRSNQTWV